MGSKASALAGVCLLGLVAFCPSPAGAGDGEGVRIDSSSLGSPPDRDVGAVPVSSLLPDGTREAALEAAPPPDDDGGPRPPEPPVTRSEPAQDAPHPDEDPCAFPPPVPYEPCEPLSRRVSALPPELLDEASDAGCLGVAGPSVPSHGRTRGVTVALEGSLLRLTGPQGILGVALPALVTDPYDWEELDYCEAVCVRATLRHTLDCQVTVEARAAHYGFWEDDDRQTGQFGFLPGVAGAGGASVPGNANLHSEANLYGGELNLYREVARRGCFRLDLLGGVRALHFVEKTTVDGFESPFPGFIGPAYVGSGARNTFLGVQVGAAAYADPHPRFGVLGSAKVLLGAVEQDLTVRDGAIFSGGEHAASSEETEFGWGVDVELGVRWRVAPRVRLTAGYNLLYLDSIVRAQDAMDFTQSTTGAVQVRHETDAILVHGLFAGVELDL